MSRRGSHVDLRAWAWVVIAGLLFLGSGGASIADEVKLDSYRVLGDLPAGSQILVKAFGTENTHFGKLKKERQKETAENMKAVAPVSLQQSLIQHLTTEGAFSEVAAYEEGELPANAVLVEGEFTILNPGNRNKRYFVGAGAGKSKVCVDGRVVTAAGELLGEFADCRSGTGMMAFTGGRAEGMMSNDIYRGAVNIGDFLSTWAAGQLPAPIKAK